MGINAINLPDKAMKGVFKRCNINESYETLQKYTETKNKIIHLNSKGELEYINNRHILMISSTSWTPDEDFNLLLESFLLTEKLIDNIEQMPKVLFIITGRGPGRDSFMQLVKTKALKLFIVESVWLESDDYPKILGSGDLGVCLHYSSSGFDLPMKVVDMFAAQLPVAAFKYDTILELVNEGENGFLFFKPEQLAKIFIKIIYDFKKNGESLEINTFRRNLEIFSKDDWDSQWEREVKPKIIEKAKLKYS